MRLAREAARSEEMFLSNSRRVRDAGPNPSPGRIPVTPQIRSQLGSLESFPCGKSFVLLVLTSFPFRIHNDLVE